MFRLPVFATAFRVFFLGCSLHALALIALWIAKLRGYDWAPTEQPAVFWHSYEMVFGFSRAAVFGFLFTAGQHWSGQFLLGGRSAAILFFLWLAGRFAFYLPGNGIYLGALVDIAAGAYALWRARPLMAPKQKHNHSVYYLVTVLLLAEVAAWSTLRFNFSSEYFLHAVHTGLLAIVFLIAIIAGRVVPFFTSVVVAGKKPVILPKLEKWIWPSMAAALAIYAASPVSPYATYAAAAALVLVGCIHAVRWVNWNPPAALPIAILAILYVGYLWMVVGFFMQAVALMGWFQQTLAWHIFGIGAVSVFIYGMMTRVALGHTGRPIKATRLVTAGYFLLNLALFARVILPITGRIADAYLYAALLWITAFAIFAGKYIPLLIKPRVDGKPG